MSNYHPVVIFSLFLLIAFTTLAISEAKKPSAAHTQHTQQQQTVAEPKKQQQQLKMAAEQVLQHTKQLQEESPTPQCAPKLHKPKSLKSLAEYELCKQECRRKRDQESANEYIDYLKEELRLAEERAEVEAQQQQQYGNGF